MFKKGNKLRSIFYGTCPRCQEDRMYLESNPYIITKLYAMQQKCSSCGLKYQMEPSFFYGAMYVSYAVAIAFGVAAFVISNLFLGTGLVSTVIIIVSTLVVFMPVIARLSRSIWINIFVKYEGKTS